MEKDPPRWCSAGGVSSGTTPLISSPPNTDVPPNAVKLLYAEDEVLLRLMLADALHEAGFQGFEASDGEESLSILKTMSVDVVVTDLRMATLTDGLELGRYVRAHCPGVSLVLASAQAPPIADVLMFDDFFVKPFAPEDLVAWITRRHASAPCVCRKLRFGRIGDEVRRPAHATQCVRPAEQRARPVHPCPMSGAFSKCCNNYSRKILGLGANAARPMRRHGRRTRDGLSRSAVPRRRSATGSPVQSACRGYPWLVIDACQQHHRCRPDRGSSSWGLVPGECFSNLLRDPFCCRVRGHIDPDKLSARQPDNDQDVEQVEADGRDHEQIHGCHMRSMIAQERAPALTGRVAVLGHVLGDRRLSHRKAELEQLTMNARRTPKQIFNAHPPDQCPQIRTDLRWASQVSRFPTPSR